jgi:hypothetical protein
MTRQPHQPDPQPARLPAFARDVLALYERELAEVRFPDLELATLEAAAARLQAAHAEAAARAEALRAAEQAVAEEEQALVGLAERALAYARIFAGGNAELSAEVAAISRPSAGAGRPTSSGDEPKKRGRPRKQAPGDGQELFTGAAAE